MGRWQGLSTVYWAGPHWAWPHRPFVPLFGTKTRAVLLIPWSPSPLPSRCVLLVLGVCHFKRFYIRHVPRRRAASSSSRWSSAALTQGAAEARPPSGPACFALGGKASPRRSLLAACMFPSSFHGSPKRLTSSSVTSNPKARFCFGAVPYSLTATRTAQRGKRQPEAYKEASCWIGPQAQGLGLEEQHSQAKTRACP